MEKQYFTNDFNKIVCTKIMEHLEHNKSLTLLNIKIEAWIRDVKPQYSQSFVNIIAATPLTMNIAKEHYAELKILSKERIYGR